MSRCLIFRAERPSRTLVTRLGLRHRWDELVECAEDGLLVHATEDGEPIALCAILRGHKDSTYHIGSLRIAVDKNHRGKGVGKRLLTETLKQLPGMGFDRVEATPYIDNFPASRLFTECGFGWEGERVKGGWDGCRPVNTHLFAWTT